MTLRNKIKRLIIQNLSAMTQVSSIKERKMILIAFENDVCPLPKQYPSSMDDWEGDDMNSSLFLPENDESSTLLP